jgi:hypothetical protein
MKEGYMESEEQTPILDLLYDVMNIFDDNEVALYSAIKSIHRRTNIEHIINHIDSQISLEQYRDAFIQIMGFCDKKINYYTRLSQFDFKDVCILMETLTHYFSDNKITHSNLRQHQEKMYLQGMINSADKLVNIIDSNKKTFKQGELI